METKTLMVRFNESTDRHVLFVGSHCPEYGDDLLIILNNYNSFVASFKFDGNLVYNFDVGGNVSFTELYNVMTLLKSILEDE